MSITAAVPELLLVSWHLDRICDLNTTVYLLRYVPRTVAEHLQAPAEDSAFPAPVNHRPALLWLISEFGAVIQIFRLNSTQLDGKLSYFPPAQQNDQTVKKKKTNRSYMLYVVYGVSVCLSVYFTQSFALSARNNLRRCEKRTPSTYDLYTL